jgi:hypothetical protein
MNYDFEYVEMKVKNSIDKLRENDSFLLKNGANEVSISSTLFCYLKNEFRDWDVDCEYNRRYNGDPKKLNVSRNGKKVNSKVKPDIIVHSRETNDNLLVIEVKKSRNSKKEISFDEKKLIEFTSKSDKKLKTTKYGYSFGLSVIFEVGKKNYEKCPSLNWYKAGKKLGVTMNDF